MLSAEMLKIDTHSGEITVKICLSGKKSVFSRMKELAPYWEQIFSFQTPFQKGFHVQSIQEVTKVFPL